ncbi:hypothetical protein [uncultured Exiguobacterium sp.]|uniref:hypothetical protein n=1 Tax=uncultured Exiguobacterium sp. TaxID=202669 RepID=UPI0025CDADB4|nr:hypothetical protein [uncultured Exiguobacterium sp.]
MEDTAKQIYMQAVRFRNASNLISKAWSETNDIDLHVAPFVVNAAFSIELHLKCLYLLENGKLPDRKVGHHLGKLYRRLSEESRIVISMCFKLINDNDPIHQELKKQVPEAHDSIEKIIEASSDAFKKWRYSYESGYTSFQSSEPVLIAIESRILQLKPEWNGTPQNVLR